MLFIQALKAFSSLFSALLSSSIRIFNLSLISSRGARAIQQIIKIIITKKLKKKKKKDIPGHTLKSCAVKERFNLAFPETISFGLMNLWAPNFSALVRIRSARFSKSSS
jgi:hypothetical protein